MTNKHCVSVITIDGQLNVFTNLKSSEAIRLFPQSTNEENSLKGIVPIKGSCQEGAGIWNKKKMRMLSETKQKLLNAKSNTHLALTANKKVNIPTNEFVDNVKPIFAFMF